MNPSNILSCFWCWCCAALGVASFHLTWFLPWARIWLTESLQAAMTSSKLVISILPAWLGLPLIAFIWLFHIISLTLPLLLPWKILLTPLVHHPAPVTSQWFTASLPAQPCRSEYSVMLCYRRFCIISLWHFLLNIICLSQYFPDI